MNPPLAFWVLIAVGALWTTAWAFVPLRSRPGTDFKSIEPAETRLRPRSAWRRIGRELMMATDPLDVAGLVRDAGPKPWRGMPAGTVMGHVHLHVRDLTVASAFYSEALGFDRTVWQYPGALFLAASGYHHHLGTNTWAGSGAKPPGADEAQLLEWTIELPNTANLDGASHSLARAGYGSEWDNSAESARALLTRDPWGMPVRLQSPTPPASGA